MSVFIFIINLFYLLMSLNLSSSFKWFSFNNNNNNLFSLNKNNMNRMRSIDQSTTTSNDFCELSKRSEKCFIETDLLPSNHDDNCNNKYHKVIQLVPKSKYELYLSQLSTFSINLLESLGTSITKYTGTKLVIVPSYDGNVSYVGFYDDETLLKSINNTNGLVGMFNHKIFDSWWSSPAFKTISNSNTSNNNNNLTTISFSFRHYDNENITEFVSNSVCLSYALNSYR